MDCFCVRGAPAFERKDAATASRGDTPAHMAAKSLLFDENPGSAHVVEFDLLERPDREIRDFAQTSGFIIVTTDADFYELACSIGPAPESAVAPPVDSSDAGC
jgi:hypothetical protein